MSLRRRIMIGYLFIVFIVLCLFAYLVLKDIRPRYLEAVEETTVDLSQVLAVSLSGQEKLDVSGTASLDSIVEKLKARKFKAKIFDLVKLKTELRIYLTNNKGVLLFDSHRLDAVGSDYSKWNDVHLTLNGKYGVRSSKTALYPDHSNHLSSLLYVASPVYVGGELAGVLSVGKPKYSISFFVDVARRKTIILGLVLAAVGLIFAFLLSFWISQPLQKLLDYTRSLKNNRYAKFSAYGSPEVIELSKAIGGLYKELEGKEYIENYVHTLTHEIKSPLTAIIGAGELLKEPMEDHQKVKFLDNIVVESKRIQSLAERMLQLSSVERQGALGQKEKIIINDLFIDLKNSMELVCHNKNIKLDFAQVDQDYSLNGDLFLLRQAISNLIHNAICFSPKNSCIQIKCDFKQEKVDFIVQDQGTGIPDYAKNKVFDRFYSLQRPDSNAKSTGLGLPFVKQVALLHNGDIVLENTDPNGLKATLSIQKVN